MTVGVILSILACSLVTATASQARPLALPNVPVTFTQNPIVANGVSTTTATATVGVAGDTFSFVSSDSGEVVSNQVDNGDGTYSATITSSTTAGPVTITFTDSTAGLSGQATLTQTAGPATRVVLALSPTSIVADGSSTSAATATVTDANGNRVTGDLVTFSASPSGVTFGPVTGHPNGTYTATITSSTTAGLVVIKATDNSVTPVVSGTAPLTETAGGATQVVVALNPPSIVANGSSTTTATATVTDAGGNPVVGDSVTFSASPTGVTFGPVTGHPDGTYTATITSSTTAGSVVIKATDTSAGGIHGQATLIQTAGPASLVTAGVSPNPIVANGSSTTTATATVTDVNGNRVTGDSVTFSASPTGVTFGPVTGHPNGIYTATITSSIKAGLVVIKATDNSVMPVVSGTAPLTLTAGPATGVAVTLNPPSILADGSSTTTATATVTDANGNPVTGQNMFFSASDTHDHISSPVIDNLNGTYTVTITGSTTVHTVTITALDTSTGTHPQGQATLTQATAGVSVTLSPTSIVANGISTTTATARVTGLQSQLLVNETVVFTSTDSGETVSPTTNNLDGTYTATITSGTTPGLVNIYATDNTAGGAQGFASLQQTTGSTATALNVVPSNPVSNQTVTMIATVDSPTAGTVAFENGGSAIAGCGNISVSAGGAATAACQTSFGAVGSPVQLTAVFSPGSGSGVAGSSSPVDAVTVKPDSTTTTVGVSGSKPTAGTSVTYLVAVSAGHSGPVKPGGSVKFSDGNQTLTGCAARPLLHGSSSSAAAVCTVTFTSLGTHVITAQYLGDASFSGSSSSPARTDVQPKPVPPRIGARMHWMFHFAPSYISVLELVIHSLSNRATVLVKCQGPGCPFAQRTIAISAAKLCKSSTTLRCSRQRLSSIDLHAAFRHRRLPVGDHLTVEILRPGWVGKYYLFTVLSRHQPRALITCLAPGSNRPGAGC